MILREKHDTYEFEDETLIQMDVKVRFQENENAPLYIFMRDK